MDFGKQTVFRIKQLMEEKGLTQRDLAEIIGKSQSIVSGMLNERPGRPIRHEYLEKIATFCDVPVEWLVADEDKTDSIRFGTSPGEEGPSVYDLQVENQNLRDQIAQLKESREYYFNLSNDLAREKQSGEDLNATTLKEVCAKQLSLSITLMKTCMEMLEL